MDKQTKIEEIIDIQRKNCLGKGVGDCVDADCNACSALAIYNAGYRKIPEGAVVVSKEWWDKSITQKTFKFYKDENLSKGIYLIPYSVCIRPSDDNMSLLSLYKTLVWCGYASENYWDWCENTKEAKEVSFYEYIEELIKAIQEKARKETAEKFAERLKKEAYGDDGVYYLTNTDIDEIAKEIMEGKV